MWKLRPDWIDSMEDSTEGKGSRPGSGGGGVSALCRGEAAKEWKWEDAAVGKGGREERLVDCGDCGIWTASIPFVDFTSGREGQRRTGVRSRSSSASVAEVAASMRSSHRLPSAEAALCGSAEKAFLPSMLNLRACSFDLVLSCLGFRAFCVMDDFRGRAGLSLRWMGGKVDDRSGGDRAMIEGSNSRGRAAWKGGKTSWLRWVRIEGSSMEDLIRSFLISRSENVSSRGTSSAGLSMTLGDGEDWESTDCFRLPVRVSHMTVQLCQSCRRARSRVHLLQCSRCCR